MIKDFMMMAVGIAAIYLGVYSLKWVFDRVERKFKI